MNRFFRPLVAAVLLCGTGQASAQAWQEADPEPALIDLAPQRYAVPEVPRDEPADVPPGGPEQTDADASRPAPEVASGIRYDLLFLDASGDETILVDCFVPGAFELLASEEAARCLDVRGPDGLDGAAASGVAPDVFGPLPSVGLDVWSLGAQNWRYRSSAGYRVTLGKTGTGPSSWGRSVRLAGVGLSRAAAQARLPVGGWDYAVAVGALDASAGRATAAGDLVYGPVAVDATTRYALDRNLTLASRVQRARDLTVLGLGGGYDLSEAGAWRFGVSGSRQPLVVGWRRQIGYALDLYPGWGLSWVNARQGMGYADLAIYGGGGCDCLSNQWQLDLAAGRWGAFSGSFERRVDASNGLDERIGLAHGFRYGPYLRVRLETNRNLTSGAYDLGARFSLPLDW